MQACVNSFFEAIHVVLKKQTQHKAIIGNPTAFILVEKAVRILDLTL
jgi:hypothetical protein